MTQLTPAAFMAIGACSLEEPQPKFLLATMMSPSDTFFTKSASMSSMQCAASSFGSEEFKYLAGMITSVSTLSPNLNTWPLAAFMFFLLFLSCRSPSGSAQAILKRPPPVPIIFLSPRSRRQLPGLQGRSRTPHGPSCLQSCGSWWKRSALSPQGSPYSRPGMDRR